MSFSIFAFFFCFTTPILEVEGSRSFRFSLKFAGTGTRVADARSVTSARLATLTAFACERGYTGGSSGLRDSVCQWTLAANSQRSQSTTVGYEARRVSSPVTRPPNRDASLGIKADVRISIPLVITS